MKLHLLPILAPLLCLVLVGTNASSPAEDYWHSVLPNTPVPQPIQDLLSLDAGNYQNEKLSDVKLPRLRFRNYGMKDQNEKLQLLGFSNYGAKDKNEKLSNVKLGPFTYRQYGTKDHNQKLSDAKESRKITKDDGINQTIFYKYNDIHPGERVTLLLDNAGNKVPFLPRELAESVPFSSDKLEDILQLFSIEPNSPDAAVVAEIIGECEDPNIIGEDKYCATSLESLIDQSVARLGKNIRVVSTPVAKRQEYTILPGMKMIANDRIAVCHRDSYPYAVYYCHEIKETEAYKVPLLGGDGTRISAITICHKDTSGWSQDHMAFKVLKIHKPGPPICHFIYTDGLAWLQTNDLGHESV